MSYSVLRWIFDLLDKKGRAAANRDANYSNRILNSIGPVSDEYLEKIARENKGMDAYTSLRSKLRSHSL